MRVYCSGYVFYIDLLKNIYIKSNMHDQLIELSRT